jgi:hypothetical protein
MPAITGSQSVNTFRNESVLGLRTTAVPLTMMA